MEHQKIENCSQTTFQFLIRIRCISLLYSMGDFILTLKYKRVYGVILNYFSKYIQLRLFSSFT